MKQQSHLVMLLLAAGLVACSPDSGPPTPPSPTAAPEAATEAAPESDAAAVTGVDEEQSEPVMDPAAIDVARQTIEFLEGLQGFSLAAEQTMDIVQDSGQKLQFSARVALDVRHPDRFHMRRQGDDGTLVGFWYDGTSLAVQSDQREYFARVAAPSTIDETLDLLELRLDTPMPMADIAYNDLSHLKKDVIAAEYIGDAVIGNTPVRHVAFRGELVDWQLWVQAEGDPLLRKLVITYKNQEGMPQFTAFLHHWTINPVLGDDVFQFDPPEGAEEILMVAADQLPQEQGSQ